MEADVTRKAVEIAAKATVRAQEKLRAILTPGPATVRLTPGELEKEVAKGNTRLLRHAVENLDDDILVRLLAGQLAKGGGDGSTTV